MVTLTRRKTKTWKHRHENKILRLVQTLETWNVKDPIVLQVGPGGIAASYAHLFPEGPEDTMGFADRKRLQFASMREARARDQEDAFLLTHETLELYEALRNSVGIGAIYTVDADPKVLQAVQRLNLPGVYVIEHDISRGPVSYNGKRLNARVGVMYKVLEYNMIRRNSVLASFMNSVEKDRGFLAMTLPKSEDRLVPSGLTKLMEDVYLNGQRSDKGRAASSHTNFHAPQLNEEYIARISQG